MPEDVEPNLKGVQQAQKNGTDFITCVVGQGTTINIFPILAILSKGNIDYMEDLYADYGSSSYFTGRCVKKSSFFSLFFVLCKKLGALRAGNL